MNRGEIDRAVARASLRGVLVGVLGMAAIGVITLGCPKPTPGPVNPTPHADAAPAPYVAPIRVPSYMTCTAAATAAKTVCPDVDEDTLRDICTHEDVAYAAKLMDAKSCADVRNADPGASGASWPAPRRSR